MLTTTFFGDKFYEWFGTVGNSMYTLFQIMTLESWSMGIVRPVMKEFPLAWLFFVKKHSELQHLQWLNLFIGIIRRCNATNFKRWIRPRKKLI